MSTLRSASNSDNFYLDQNRLLAIQTMLVARLDSLLEALDINLVRSRKLYSGRCPIHEGKNSTAINIYTDGHAVPGFWRCNTKKCHETFKSTIIGFVRGVLSAQRLDWTWSANSEQRRQQKLFGWNATIDWCCEFLGQKLSDIKVDTVEIEKRRFASDWVAASPAEKKGLTRNDVRKWLVRPCDYFVKRGFSKEVLDKYDVGNYPVEGRPLSGRAVVPCYDNDGKYSVGFTGRIIEESTDKPKWVNHNLLKESCLYNYWFAKQHIRDSQTVGLVEGPGCIWKLEEAGIHNCVAMLGSDLSDQQQILLELSGAMNVIILVDNDDAGNEARVTLKKKLGRSFRLHFPSFAYHDIGEMPIPEVKQLWQNLLK